MLVTTLKPVYAVNNRALVVRIDVEPCGAKGEKCAGEKDDNPQPMNTSSNPSLIATTHVSARPTHTAGPRLSPTSSAIHTVPASIVVKECRK